MTYEFNAFATPLTNSETLIAFAAGPDMPAGYEVHLIGTGLSYNNATGAMTGTITSIELYDPAFGLSGGARQTISIAAGDQAGLAANISSFLGSGLGMMADTFAAGTGWDLVGDGFHHIGNVVFGPGGTSLRLELVDADDVRVGYLLIEGTNLTDATLSQTGTITKITNLDINEAPIADEEITYTPARPASAFQYALLSLNLPAPEGGIIGNDEVLYPVLVAGENTITKLDGVDGYPVIEGGASDDNFVTTTGGHVFYVSATSGVLVDLAAGTASGGGGDDLWTPGSIGAATGSAFGDTLSGSNFNSWLRGEEGEDTLTGLGAHDTLDGGGSNDTITGGDGDDWLFGGLGDDTIHGGANAGDNYNDAGDGTDDVLFYSLLGVTSGSTKPASVGIGEGAADYLTGIVVTFSGSGAGTVTGAAGTDTFDGIEEVWGSRNGDTFNFFDGANNRVTGFGGADVFNGSTGIDYVNYDAEIFDNRNTAGALNGTFNTGVYVNMSTVTHTVGSVTIGAGEARDSFGDTDTFNGGIEIVSGTSFNDVLIGNGIANELYGREGADVLVGGAGNDIIWTGNPGDVNGGSAADYVDYRRDGGASAIVVTANSNGTTTVTDTHGNTDTVRGFGAIIGTNGNDTFNGSTLTDRFGGGQGNDTYTSNGPGIVAGGDQLTYMFEDQGVNGFGIVYDAALGTIVTNDGLSTFWGTDTLVGFSRVWLEATQYDDILTGGAGDDVFLASLGIDDIDGGGGSDALFYIDFHTTLRGGGIVYNADALTAGTGTVTESNLDVDTYSNIEVLAGSMLNDTFNGSAFNERFLGHGGNDTFNGGGGSDTVSYSFDAAVAFGLAIDLDRLVLGWSPANPPAAPHGIIADLDFLAGSVIGIFENMNTGTEEDTDVLVGINNLTGSSYNDDITGNDNANILDGLLGADRLEGLDGNDVYTVDSALDVVVEALNKGTDTIKTSVTLTAALAANVEKLELLAGAVNGTGNGLGNTITGNNAANTLDGGAGIDTLIGGANNDTYKVTTGDVITETAGQGTADRAKASQSYVLGANANIEFLETALATATTAINLTGNGLASQTITGNNGVNTINGLGGIDIISGLNGNDIINGGLGNDRLTGGANNDTFIFNTSLSTTLNRDTITDFFAPQDTIKLENTGIFSALGVTLGTLSANKFWASNTGVAHDADDRIIYNKLTGVLTYDSNGNAAGGAVQFAVLTGHPSITNADFIVI